MIDDMKKQGINVSVTQEVVYTTDELDKMGVFDFHDEVGLDNCPFCNQEIEVPESLMFHNIKCSNCGKIIEIGPSELSMSRDLTRQGKKDFLNN